MQQRLFPRRRRHLWWSAAKILSLCLLSLLVGPGCGGEGGEGEALAIEAVTFNHQAFPPSGGDLTLTVRLTGSDASSVQTVEAQLQPAGPSPNPVSLQATGASTWSGTTVLPANDTGQPQVYRATVTATTQAGQRVTSQEYQITVAATAVPPMVSLSVSPPNVDYRGGTVTVTAAVNSPIQAGIQAVELFVDGPGFDPQEPISLPLGQASQYSTELDLPSNRGVTAHVYQLTVEATDEFGQKGTATGATAALAAPHAPPAPI